MNKFNLRLVVFIPLLTIISIFIGAVFFIHSPFFENLYYNHISRKIDFEMETVSEKYDLASPLNNTSLLRSFQEASHAGLFILDNDGVIVDASPNLKNPESQNYKEVLTFVDTWLKNPSLYDSIIIGGETAELKMIGSLSGTENTILIRPLNSNNKTVGVLFCNYPVQSLSPTTEFIYDYLLPLLALTSGGLLLLMWFITGWYAKPLNRLALKFKASHADISNVNLNTPRKLVPFVLDALSNLQIENQNLVQRIQAQEQEAMYRVAFTGRVSHELKTPIGLIRSYAEALRDRVQNDSKRNHYESVIIEETLRTETLLNDLMDLARLETGNYKLSSLPFQLKPLILESLSVAEPSINNKGIQLVVECPEEDFMIFADEDRIRQVFRNILNNSLCHTSLQGTLILRVKPSIESSSIFVEIENTGSPIPNELLPHIWDQFYTIDLTGGRDKEGSGLDLAIVRSILKIHGCHYEASNTQTGVLFSFSLPLHTHCS